MKQFFGHSETGHFPGADHHVPVLVVTSPNLLPGLNRRVQDLCGKEGWPRNGAFDLLTVWNNARMETLVRHVCLAYTLHGTRQVVVAMDGQSASYLQPVKDLLQESPDLREKEIQVVGLEATAESTPPSKVLVVACMDAQHYGEANRLGSEIQIACGASTADVDVFATPGGVRSLCGLVDDDALCRDFKEYLHMRYRDGRLDHLILSGHRNGYGCGAFNLHPDGPSLYQCLRAGRGRWKPEFPSLRIDACAVNMIGYPRIQVDHVAPRSK